MPLTLRPHRRWPMVAAIKQGMLTMKAILIFFLLLFVGSAWAQSQEIKKPVAPTIDKTTGANKSKDDSKGHRTIELPPAINVTVGGKLEGKTEDDDTKRNDEGPNWAEWAIAAFTGLLVFVTGWLVYYTKNLWGSTQTAADDARKTATQQAKDMQKSLGIAQQYADATTKAAEAAIVSSMPVLSPLIVIIEGGGILHPFRSEAEHIYNSGDQTITFKSGIDFVFENFGKTPGIIREVRSDLFLCENDQFPTVDFGQLPSIDYQPIIPGESRGQDAFMGVAEYRKRMSLTSAEFNELLAEATTDGQYRRFPFIGMVIYDDFFGSQHRRRFCVKLRRMYPHGGIFQLVRGDSRYNHVERLEAPKNEPPST